MISQQEFEAKIEKFDDLEPNRGALYKMGLRLIEKGYTAEAYLLILATWNFAGFRYILTKKFDLKKFHEVINKTDSTFKILANYTFKSADIELKRFIRSLKL